MSKTLSYVLLSSSVMALFSVACSEPSGGDGDDGADASGGSAGATGESATGGASGTSSGGISSGGMSGGGTNSGGTTGGDSGGGAAGAAAGGTSSGGAGAFAATCDGACARVVGAACGPTTQADCVAGCNTLAMSCPAEVAPYVECVTDPANTITCADMAADVAGCDDVILDLSVCSVCAPASTDLACAACSRASCCEELQAYVSAADVEGFDPCVAACSDRTCVDSCAAEFPAAGVAYDAVAACQLGTCGEDCVCQASDSDTECIACAKLNCCSDLVPYVAADDVEVFAACIEPCADQVCLDDCISAHPTAGAAYGTLLGCLEGSCLTECQ